MQSAKQIAQPPKVAPKARNYVFTVNFSKAFYRLLDCSLWEGHISYCIYQVECGEEGTLHFQGYLECIGQKTWVQLHKLPGLETARFATRHGTGPQAIAYCRKQDETYVEGPWEWGTPKAPGTRSDLLDIQQKIKDGMAMTRIAEENYASWVRHYKAFREYRRITTKPRNFKPKVFLFIGPAGKGKSTLMKLIASYIGTVNVVAQPKGSGVYFDDYDGQDVIIFDEFDGHFMKPTMFNTIFDEHECVIPVHGGAGHQCVSKYMFIGSNYLPRQWWKGRNAAQLRQITRRIDVVFKVGFANPTEPKPNPTQPNRNKVVVQPFAVYVNDYVPPLYEVHARHRKRARPGDQYGLPPIDGG